MDLGEKKVILYIKAFVFCLLANSVGLRSWTQRILSSRNTWDKNFLRLQSWYRDLEAFMEAFYFIGIPADEGMKVKQMP